MISEKDANDILVELGYQKLKVSKFDTWIEQKLKQEGFELIQGKIRSFWIKEGQRVYGEPCSDPVTKVYQTLMSMGENKEVEKKNDVSLPEKKEDTKKETEKPGELALLPEFITTPLMEKWKKMSTIDRMLMFQKTPEDQIFQVAVGKDETGKMQYASYVKGNFMIREANAAFLFDWSLEIYEVRNSGSGVSVRGKLIANVDGKYLSRPATGYQELNKKMDAELATKAATTDAIKKGLSLFGFNSDVYSGEV